MEENSTKESADYAKLIKSYEDDFQKALAKNAEPSLLNYMKKNIDFLREKELDALNKESNNSIGSV